MGKYVYGIIGRGEEKSFGPIGLVGGRKGEVYTVPYKDIACVVSDSPIQTYAPELKEVMARRLVDHQTVIERVMNEYNILPMKFGTVVNDTDEIKIILEYGYNKFKNTLSKMENKVEWDVVTLWTDLDSVLKEIGETDEKIKRFKEEIASKPPEESFEDRIKIGSMVKEILDRRKDECVDQIQKNLKGLTCGFVNHELMDDRMVMNTAFLMEKDKEKDFDARINELDARYKDQLHFKCVGPLPPYSFSTIEVERLEFQQVDHARKILGLGKRATLDEIKEAHRVLAQKFHPDRDPNDLELPQKFKEITEAYKLLIDYCQGEECTFDEEGVKDFFRIRIGGVG